MEWVTPITDISQLTQGSIVDGIDWECETDNPVSIVLSNACDIEHNHASFIIVAAMYPASHIIACSREYRGLISGSYNESTRKQQDRVKDKLSEYVHHKTINRYYFIDCRQCKIGMCMMVDFQKIKSVPINTTSSLALIANLNTPLKEQMIMQFVSYTSRIPTDRVDRNDEEQIISSLITEIQEIESENQ